MTDCAISVVVCTRDRADQLRRLLESMTGLRIPAGLTWELVVVDNGSRNDTARTAQAFAERLPIRLLHEPRPGLSRARNAGVRAARGRYLCWTDDDALVPGDWLETYWNAFQAHPEAAVFGGRIVAVAAGPAARWFARYIRLWPLSSVAASRDLGPVRMPLAPVADCVPWGTNYAVRAREQRAVLYDEGLPAGEETDVIARILRRGASGWWLPESCVTHIIPAERQTHAYLAQYFRRAGYVAAYLREREARDGVALAGADGWTGRPAWVRASTELASRAGRAAASAVGMERLSLTMLARSSYLRGITDFRVAGAAAQSCSR